MKQKKKVFTSAPLPFMGQKRRMLKDFKKALEQYPADATYVDLFGGSGLLSHTVKSVYTDAKVVYNDFDGYSERIANIPKTNALLADIREILKDEPHGKRIESDARKLVLQRVAYEKGYIDFITLSSSLLFSMKYVLSYEALECETLYNNVKMSDYDAAGYLQGIKSVTMDYKALFAQYKGVPNVVFLVDPPYLSTEVGTYKNYWKLGDYLDVLNVLKGSQYFYFTSHKSNIIELCKWIENNTGGVNPFDGAVRTEMKTYVRNEVSYIDTMLYKWTTNYSI